jgi:hypothetical protein
MLPAIRLRRGGRLRETMAFGGLRKEIMAHIRLVTGDSPTVIPSIGASPPSRPAAAEQVRKARKITRIA